MRTTDCLPCYSRCSKSSLPGAATAERVITWDASKLCRINQGISVHTTGIIVPGEILVELARYTYILQVSCNAILMHAVLFNPSSCSSWRPQQSCRYPPGTVALASAAPAAALSPAAALAPVSAGAAGHVASPLQEARWCVCDRARVITLISHHGHFSSSQAAHRDDIYQPHAAAPHLLYLPPQADIVDVRRQGLSRVGRQLVGDGVQRFDQVTHHVYAAVPLCAYTKNVENEVYASLQGGRSLTGVVPASVC